MDEPGSPIDHNGQDDAEDVTLGMEEALPFHELPAPEIPGYQTLRLLGQGGMGRVYLAKDGFLDRLVAIKVISEALPREAEPVARFQREARAMAAIEHPNIVHIYAYGIDAGRPYFVMQYIEGESLADRMGRLAQAPLDETVQFGLQIVDALEAAWLQKIVHRDLKPANVLIDNDGNAHVADFGLAMAVRSTIASGPAMDRGKILGTPRYIAPEQAQGGEVDFRADLYSLGLMLYEVLAGVAPFEGLTPLRMMAKRLDEPVPSVRLKRPDLPIEVDRLITWLTTRDPDLRPESHEALRDRLRELVSARPPAETEILPPDAPRSRSQETFPGTFDPRVRPPAGPGRQIPAEPRMLGTKLIGRDQELDRLGLHTLELLNGKGAIVSIVGPAGIGKSRLLSELKREYSTRNVTFLEGRARARGETLSFHPLIDILKNWARISEHDSNPEAIHKLETAIRTVDPSGADEVFPFIATLMGLKLFGTYQARVAEIEGHNLRQLIFKNLRNLIMAAAQARPLVLAFEDLHWADQTSLELLKSLYGLAMNHPILFINLFRPRYDETAGHFASALAESYGPYYHEIVLQPLSAAACEQILGDLLGSPDLPTPIKQPIIDKTDGNPYFLEEIARSLLDEGAVRVERGQLKATERIDLLEVPETVQEVLQARIDRLDEGTREVIRVGSVIGRTFFYAVIADVAKGLDRLDDRLQNLEHLGMIGRHEQLGQLAYTFRHALMQDVVYASILDAQRRQLHLEIARSIERLFSERENEFFGMLAYHYCAAEDLDKSEKYLVKAGGEAQRAAASSEALGFYQRALKLYSDRRGARVDRKTMATLERNVALALYNHGSYGESIECFRKVLPAFGIRPPTSGMGLAATFVVSFVDFLVTVHVPTLRFRRHPTPADSEGIQLYYQQLSALAHHDPVRFFLESFVLARRLRRFDLAEVDNGVGMFVSAGNVLSWTGASFYLSKKVLRLLEDKVDHDQPKALISYEAAKVTHAFLAGEWGAISHDDDLVGSALDLGETYFSANYVIFHGRTALEQGRFDEALTLAEMLNRMGIEYDHSYPPALHVYLHAKILFKQRLLLDAVAECDDGRQAAEIAATDTVLFGLASLRARAMAYMGDVDAANELLEHIAESSQGTRLPKSYKGDFLISRSTVDVMLLEEAIRRGDGAKTELLLHSAERSSRLLLKNSAKVASHQVEASKLAGLVEWLAGQPRKAARCWQRGIQIGEHLGADLDLSRLYKEIGVRLQTSDTDTVGLMPRSSGEYLDRARAMFQLMDLEWDLAELESLESGTPTPVPW